VTKRRLRLDAELVRRGLARSREEARELIDEGRITLGGVTASKGATSVTTDVAINMLGPIGPRYASRGAYKLLGALERFTPKGLVVAEQTCLDLGASTGGFTDVLLRHGAKRVYAVDVGYGQLVWALQSDERVTVLDRTNARNLTLANVGGTKVNLVVADLSFISLTLVLPAVFALCMPDADLVVMVKPQFEVGKEKVGKGGVVRDANTRIAAVRQVAESANSLGWGAHDIATSPLPGPSGNVEFFLWLRKGDARIGQDTIEAEVNRFHAAQVGDAQ
jgi:23S rRNA (cytidine1920-2'-O)/16S rRNA (cytidine1409-2'-O)-methyltransferase